MWRYSVARYSRRVGNGLFLSVGYLRWKHEPNFWLLQTRAKQHNLPNEVQNQAGGFHLVTFAWLGGRALPAGRNPTSACLGFFVNICLCACASCSWWGNSESRTSFLSLWRYVFRIAVRFVLTCWCCVQGWNDGSSGTVSCVGLCASSLSTFYAALECCKQDDKKTLW